MVEQLTFEERINKKREAGFDAFQQKEKLNKRIEERNQFKDVQLKQKQDRKKQGITIIGDGKKEPKIKYSKLPVSAIKRDVLSNNTQTQVRDPRFMETSGNLN